MHSPVHQASLVDPALHSPALLELVDLDLSKPVVEYLVESVVETVDFAMGRPHTPRATSQYRKRFTSFAATVLTRAEVTTSTVLSTLVYLARARPHLSIALEEWALERVFLGALIVASKYTNDSTLKNVHWALCTGVFGKRDVGRIEREFLEVLDWELAIREADVLAHHQAIIEVASPKATLVVSAYTPPSPASSSISTPELASPVSSSSTLASSSSPSTPAHSPAHVAAIVAPEKAPAQDIPMDVVDDETEPEPERGRPCKRGGGSGIRLHHLFRSIPLPHRSRHPIHV
ncbi:Cyclin N-terminal domain-containing protein [Mycena kentingensis (nom. inval.)]|nr:Cyclin N-terminal domain-containing protein [Mycena kentingensis (nom. inval.)]